MRALVVNEGLEYRPDYPRPEAPPGWARIRVRLAGICGTDLEIVRGYAAFRGVPGHEFVGDVESCGDSAWLHRRVAGEINVACGRCRWCREGLGRHCPDRRVLGIRGHEGCLAEYCTLPVENLVALPPEVSDDRAVFLEPLSAACEILDQLALDGTERIAVLGDGRLGVLCAWVLSTVAGDVTLFGHHAGKLARARWRDLRTVLAKTAHEGRFDVVVEATGSERGFDQAVRLCRARGNLVLKSTCCAPASVDLVPVVVNELTVTGSRCGRFSEGLRMLRRYPDMPLEGLITARYSIEDAGAAIARAGEADAHKVVLQFGEPAWRTVDVSA